MQFYEWALTFYPTVGIDFLSHRGMVLRKSPHRQISLVWKHAAVLMELQRQKSAW